MKNFNELNLSKDLIKFKSITPKDDGAIKYLSSKLKQLGLNCKILKFYDKKKISDPILNLYARKGSKAPNICYAGHTDVVPPAIIVIGLLIPSVQNKKGYLIGRGANDMKSSIACFISAVSEYLKI